MNWLDSVFSDGTRTFLSNSEPKLGDIVQVSVRFFKDSPVEKDWNTPADPYDQCHCCDFYGGDLAGIKEKIPYLKKLGVNASCDQPTFFCVIYSRSLKKKERSR